MTVYNRTGSKAEPLADQGAEIVDRPVELADRDVVFVMVSASKDLEEVMLGPGGLLTATATPQVIVDSSTVSATVSGKIRDAANDRGSAFLAAPVSGNRKVVAPGKLIARRVRPARDLRRASSPCSPTSARRSTYVGEGEVARLVKICHNLMLGVVTQSLAEITVLAEKGGVTRAAFLDFLNDRVMGSVFTRYKSPAFVNLDYTPTFTPVLLRKDFDLGLAAARELDVPMPVAAADRPAGAGQRQQRPGRRGLRDPARPAGAPLGPRAEARERRPSTTGSAPQTRWLTCRTPRSPRPGTWGSTTRSGSTSTGSATTGSAARRPRWRPASAARSCCSTSTTSATPPRPGSAVRSATR